MSKNINNIFKSMYPLIHGFVGNIPSWEELYKWGNKIRILSYRIKNQKKHNIYKKYKNMLELKNYKEVQKLKKKINSKNYKNRGI